ncbi:MAG: hypothetical protein WBA77_16660 [Microcoleaceae cyanobacterium]
MIFDYPTITELTDYIKTVISPNHQPKNNQKINPELAAIQQLSDAEAEILLQQELDRLQ